MRLTYGPVSYHRLGAVWPRRRLREPWVGRVRMRAVVGEIAGPIVPPAFTLGAVAISVRSRYDVAISEIGDPNG